MSDQIPPALEAIRRQAGGRLDTPPPIETPNDVIPGVEGENRSKKRTIEIEDDLADALRVVNAKLEEVLESGEDIPDAAIPELQKMGELGIRIVESGAGNEEAGAPPQGAPAPGGAPQLPGGPAAPQVTDELELL